MGVILFISPSLKLHLPSLCCSSKPVPQAKEYIILPQRGRKQPHVVPKKAEGEREEGNGGTEEDREAAEEVLKGNVRGRNFKGSGWQSLVED